MGGNRFWYPFEMTEQPPPPHFKVDMPQIPGVTGPSAQPPRGNPMLPLTIALLVIGMVILVAFRWFAHHKPVEPVRVDQAPQIEVPAPPPDPKASLPQATVFNPAIASVAEMAKPWSSANFSIRNSLTGENVAAILIRLPGGSGSQASGYWAFARKAPYGTCELEYVTDLEALRTGYGYRAASHPLVGNPCSHTLYDPLKTANLAGNTWVRGGIVQGSDLRPPFGVEIKIQGKDILAIRPE
jgi:hypothetical protein